MAGLVTNIRVVLGFITAWLGGRGSFLLEGRVEDSATAEISGAQLWQWLGAAAKLEGEHKVGSGKFDKCSTELINS